MPRNWTRDGDKKKRGRPRKNQQPDPPSAADPSDEWGAAPAQPTPEPDPPVLDLGDKPDPVDPEIAGLGAPDESSRGAQKWAHQLLMRRARQVSIDPTLSNRERDKRVLMLLAAAAKHYPDAVRFDDAEELRREQQDARGKSRGRAGAQVQPAPAAGSAKVIPIR